MIFILEGQVRLSRQHFTSSALLGMNVTLGEEVVVEPKYISKRETVVTHSPNVTTLEFE